MKNRSLEDMTTTTPIRDSSHQISINRKLSQETTTPTVTTTVATTTTAVMNDSSSSYSSPKPNNAFISYSTGPLRRAIAGLVVNTTQRYISIQQITTVHIGKGCIYMCLYYIYFYIYYI